MAAEQGKYQLLIDVLQRLHAATRGERRRRTGDQRTRASARLAGVVARCPSRFAGRHRAGTARARAHVAAQLNDASAELSRLFGGKGRDEALAAAAEKVERLTADYQQLQAQIRRESPRYAAVTQPQPLSAADPAVGTRRGHRAAGVCPW